MIDWPRAIRPSVPMTQEEARVIFDCAEAYHTIPWHVLQRLESDGFVRLGHAPVVDWASLGMFAWPGESLCECCSRPLASKVEMCDRCGAQKICNRCSDRHRLHSCTSPYQGLSPTP
jgi:hypothetical protein